MSPITKSTTGPAPFTVGIALDGAGWHPAAWREPAARPAELFTSDYWQDLVDTAEAGGADYVTLEDALEPQRTAEPGLGGSIVAGRLDALLTASWIAPRTRRIGLIPTVTTTHTEPFHVATALQTLDHVSLGRAGWQLRFSASEAAAAAFGRKPAPVIDLDAVAAAAPDAGLDELAGEAADAAEVARRLWDSWEDDAVIRDVETGRYLDRDLLHHIRFSGERFDVVGPSIVPRSPQGQLPVTLLAHSAPIFALAARVADVVFVTPGSASPRAGASRGKTAAELVAEVRSAEANAGREALGFAPLRIVADLVVAIDGAADVDAADDGAASTDGAAGVASATETARERIARLDAASGTAFESDAAIAAGSVDEVADTIARLREAGVEGVRLRPLAIPADLISIAAELLPLLRARGLAAPSDAREGGAAPASLRERFGLAPAVNRYAEPGGAGTDARDPDAVTRAAPARAAQQEVAA